MSSSAYKNYTDDTTRDTVLRGAEADINDFLRQHAIIVAGNIQRNGVSPLQNAILPTIRNEYNVESDHSGRIYIDTSGSEAYTQFFREFFKTHNWKLTVSMSHGVTVRIYVPGTLPFTPSGPNSVRGHSKYTERKGGYRRSRRRTSKNRRHH